jgi:hypothetical protein
MTDQFLPALTAAALVAGCAGAADGRSAVFNAAGPDGQTANLEAVCADARAWQRQLRSIEPGAIVGLRPKHIVDTCSGTSQAAGTILILRPKEASAWIPMLRCPSARVFFGGADDDSWIPDGWVDLDVRPEGDGAAITISAESVSKNIKLLERASAFARSR